MDDTRFRSDRGGDQPYAAEEEYQDSDVPNYAAEEHYQDNEVPARRHGLVFVVAIFGLALVGAACAVGYRNMFVGSVSPTLPPAIKAISTIASVSEPQAESSGNARQIGPATTGTIGTPPRVKSNQPRLGARKPLRALRYPGRACLRRRLPVRRYQTKRYRA